MTYLILDVLIAYILDLLIGDPYSLPHPVRFIGWLISRFEKLLRKSLIRTKDKQKGEFIAGIFLASIVIILVFLIVLGITKLAALVSPILFHVVNIYIIYTSFATKCLGDEARKVFRELINNNITKARVQLSMLVGRQTENLTEKEIIRGVVETTAENTVDGIISPIFYAVIGSLFGIGAPLVYVFKSVSTLDSMVGYMNEKYLYFGRASAKIDDFFNFIPARFSGILIPFAAFFCGKNYINSFKIMLRDRLNHKSPNCAYPEAAIAGALGVKLGGDNVYFGKIVKKPTMGDSLKELESKDIKDTIKIMYVTSFLSILILIGSINIILYFLG